MIQQNTAGATDFCPKCYLARDEWRWNGGRGYGKDGQTYCCPGCVDGPQCECGEGM
jgi:hypothetical protein